jgi:hypothetical protein
MRKEFHEKIRKYFSFFESETLENSNDIKKNNCYKSSGRNKFKGGKKKMTTKINPTSQLHVFQLTLKQN